MNPLKLNHATPPLTAIGSVSNLGATVVEGDPQVSVAMIYGEPQDAFTCGLFASTRGAFRMTYPFTEHATMLEGEVEITNELTGESERYKVGDGWFVEQGTPTTWRVLTDHFVKHYLANVEDR
ncbi:cupin domain-containing protein [Chimaeribacter californicus]|uniref:cupin domain-containing protein n=1 Tax=Chimaeribacter californicus TaxID=2060067 RepID=UPI0013FD0E7D|nr:cupin domain-containing protein [Chimaeribacter californicus]